MSFSDLTLKITKLLSKKEKKEYGFFATPQSIVIRLIDHVLEYCQKNNIIIEATLEPSCGSCEIVRTIDEKIVTTIDAIEYNKKIYENIKDLEFKNPVQIYSFDFLKYKTEKMYDLIIGNPPYFVFPKEDVPSEYNEYITGRPNIFGIFILHSLSMLKMNGILAFIIPKSFLNSAYYGKIRNYIKSTCTIIDIIDFEENNDFLDTQQSTFGFIIQKIVTKNKCGFSIKFGDNYIFTENVSVLNGILEGSTTLHKLGFIVKTGTLVWNQHKDKLTDDPKKTLLIYNSNVSDEHGIIKKTFNNDEKKQYINMDGQRTKCIVVNRGNGNSAYKLSYSLVNLDEAYLIENHLNMIIYKGEKDQMKMYASIMKSLKNKKTDEFIRIFLGNNGLSKTELETIFPIYLED